jgi:hypothetical protein
VDKCCLSEENEIGTLIDRMMSGLYTAMPGVIVSFDPATCLASVQPAVRMKTVIAGVVNYIDLPVVEHVPICLPHSATGGLFLTVPIKSGDQCLIVFSQRGIDNVVDAGGIQNPPDCQPPSPSERVDPRSLSELRHHDMTDAICIPSLMCAPNAIADWADDAIEIRTEDGLTNLSVKSDQVTVQAGIVTMTVSASGISIVGPVNVTGEVTANGIPLSTHIHTGGTIERDTGAPTT